MGLACGFGVVARCARAGVGMDVCLRREEWLARPCEVLISADRTPQQAWADRLAARLRPNGLAVHRTFNGDEALEIARHGSLGLAVLDTHLPRLSALGLLRRIRSVAPTLPCVLVAGWIDERYLQKALALRAFSVLTTPVNESILRDLVAAAFRRFYERPMSL